MKYAVYMIYIVGIIIIIVLVGYSTFFQPDIMRKEVEELYLNGEFSIGTVSAVDANKYSDPQVLGGIHYRFETSSGTIFAVLGGARVKQISEATNNLFKRRLAVGIKSGDRFLVLYAENDPKNAILLLDHPINSDSDFARYKAEIEELRQDPKWRGFK